MPTFDPTTKTITSDAGDVYTFGKAKGRKPTWVAEWIANNGHLIDAAKTIEPTPTIKENEMTKPAKTSETTDATTSIFDNPIYQNHIISLDRTKIIFEGKVISVTSIKDVKFKINFDMVQKNTTPMCFNNDFGGVQKTNEDGYPILSPECVARHGFDQNDLQNNFTVDGFKTLNFLVRGGIRTDKNDKNGNVSLTKAINLSCVASKFKKVQNDRLGFKADEEKNENYLNEEIGYLDTTFSVNSTFFLLSFVKNIMGTDFAQKNALKNLPATDVECQDFINTLIPTKDNVLDCDAILCKIVSTFTSNLKRFSHRGIYAEFDITNLTISRGSF